MIETRLKTVHSQHYSASKLQTYTEWSNDDPQLLLEWLAETPDAVLLHRGEGAMIRLCPICSSTTRQHLYSFTTTYAGAQTLWACACGMIYAEGSLNADYISASIYTAPGALGSGSSPHDAQRLLETALLVAAHIPSNASVLDIGCAQGGLLDALQMLGHTNLTGLDPAESCVLATRERGHKAHQGTIDTVAGHFDCITLSHVLEHILDVRPFLAGVADHLTPAGTVYIEVPDARRYADFPNPLLDLNSEHINHFSLQTLANAVNADCRLFVTACGAKEITLTNGARYPALWAIARLAEPKWDFLRALDAGTYQFHIANQKLEQSLTNSPDITLYGAGEYLCHVLAMPAISNRNVVQIVDRNSSLWGREINGCLVAPPSALLPDIPIVIAAIVGEQSIRAGIAKMELANPVYGLEF